jgi:hypothetical protein
MATFIVVGCARLPFVRALRSSTLLVLVLAFFAVLAYAAEPATDDPTVEPLQLWETKVISTHDSTHVRSPRWFPAVFSGYPQGLLAQLDGGVRSLELDLLPVSVPRGQPQRFVFRPVNFPGIDDGAVCALDDCFRIIVAWMQRNPRHFPLTIIVDPDVHENFPVFSTPEDWIDFGAYLLQFMAPVRSRVFTYSDLRGHAERRMKLGEMTVDAMRGKVILAVDNGENNLVKLAQSGALTPERVPFWLFCARSDAVKQSVDAPWCHFIKVWGMLRFEHHWAVQSHYLLRHVVDYRLLQNPLLLHPTPTTPEQPIVLRHSGEVLAPNLEAWSAELLFNALDSSQDGYLNFRDVAVRELLESFHLDGSFVIKLLLQIGMPRAFAGVLWRVLLALPVLGDDLRVTTDIAAARKNADDILHVSCGQLMLTDTPSSLFGDLPYSMPVPPNGEFFLSPCMTLERRGVFNATLYDRVANGTTLFKPTSALLTSQQWQEYARVPTLPSVVNMYFMCWMIYGAVWLTSPFLAVGWFFRNHPALRRVSACMRRQLCAGKPHEPLLPGMHRSKPDTPPPTVVHLRCRQVGVGVAAVVIVFALIMEIGTLQAVF